MICLKFKMTKVDHQEEIQGPTFGTQNMPKTCSHWVGRMGPYTGFLSSNKCHAWPDMKTLNSFCKVHLCSMQSPAFSMQSPRLLHAAPHFQMELLLRYSLLIHDQRQTLHQNLWRTAGNPLGHLPGHLQSRPHEDLHSIHPCYQTLDGLIHSEADPEGDHQVGHLAYQGAL